MKENIITAVVLILVVASIAFSVTQGSYNQETVECHQWASEAAQYNGFYIVQWQADQCKAHNIAVNAPVK